MAKLNLFGLKLLLIHVISTTNTTTNTSVSGTNTSVSHPTLSRPGLLITVWKKYPLLQLYDTIILIFIVRSIIHNNITINNINTNTLYHTHVSPIKVNVRNIQRVGLLLLLLLLVHAVFTRQRVSCITLLYNCDYTSNRTRLWDDRSCLLPTRPRPQGRVLHISIFILTCSESDLRLHGDTSTPMQVLAIQYGRTINTREMPRGVTTDVASSIAHCLPGDTPLESRAPHETLTVLVWVRKVLSCAHGYRGWSGTQQEQYTPRRVGEELYQYQYKVQQNKSV